jgi:hypothetical protein
MPPRQSPALAHGHSDKQDSGLRLPPLLQAQNERKTPNKTHHRVPRLEFGSLLGPNGPPLLELGVCFCAVPELLGFWGSTKPASEELGSHGCQGEQGAVWA